MGVALDPAEALEPVDQRGYGARGEGEPVAQLARGQPASLLEMIHRLELNRWCGDPTCNHRVQAIVLQTEAAERRKQFSRGRHAEYKILTAKYLDRQVFNG
jgi:hypothetical protein